MICGVVEFEGMIRSFLIINPVFQYWIPPVSAEPVVAAMTAVEEVVPKKSYAEGPLYVVNKC